MNETHVNEIQLFLLTRIRISVLFTIDQVEGLWEGWI